MCRGYNVLKKTFKRAAWTYLRENPVSTQSPPLHSKTAQGVADTIHCTPPSQPTRFFITNLRQLKNSSNETRTLDCQVNQGNTDSQESKAAGPDTGTKMKMRPAAGPPGEKAWPRRKSGHGTGWTANCGVGEELSKAQRESQFD